MLFETFHKTTIRILNIRLSKICSEKAILKGYNFAGLPGDCTNTPIQALTYIIEEAKEKKKEL